ncbi:MAG: DNA-3-methyladenine glycosylase I [Clostridiales bacterium]|nr:DNA-3-methyladenine glycosylase I [Clostridiales bacterium]
MRISGSLPTVRLSWRIIICVQPPPLSDSISKDLKKRGMKFVGSTIT